MGAARLLVLNACVMGGMSALKARRAIVEMDPGYGKDPQRVTSRSTVSNESGLLLADGGGKLWGRLSEGWNYVVACQKVEGDIF